MHQSGAEALITEEPDALIGHVRDCGGLAGNRRVYPEAFLVGLEGDEVLLGQTHKALANPVWPLSLGRKSYVPSSSPYLGDGLRKDIELRIALLEYPLLLRSRKADAIRLVLEFSAATHESRMDTPISFALGRREFRERFGNTEYVGIDAFSWKEDDDVPFTDRA